MLVPILKEDFFFLAKSCVLLKSSFRYFNSSYSYPLDKAFYYLLNKTFTFYINLYYTEYNKQKACMVWEFELVFLKSFNDAFSTYLSSQNLPSRDYKGNFLLDLK